MGVKRPWHGFLVLWSSMDHSRFWGGYIFSASVVPRNLDGKFYVRKWSESVRLFGHFKVLGSCLMLSGSEHTKFVLDFIGQGVSISPLCYQGETWTETYEMVTEDRPVPIGFFTEPQMTGRMCEFSPSQILLYKNTFLDRSLDGAKIHILFRQQLLVEIHPEGNFSQKKNHGHKSSYNVRSYLLHWSNLLTSAEKSTLRKKRDAHPKEDW